MKKVLVLQGVNLNMLGKRDSKYYGTETIEDINKHVKVLADELGCSVEIFQTNYEGAICEKIHQAHIENVDAVLIHAGAWTHYSYAIRDALELLKVPIMEIHMSNTNSREEFRHHSVIAPLATGQFIGVGIQCYLCALRAAWELIK